MSGSLKKRVLSGLARIAFASPLQVSARDRLRALELLGEHLSMSGSEEQALSTPGLIVVPAKTPNWRKMLDDGETA